jgi:hypothetical protein
MKRLLSMSLVVMLIVSTVFALRIKEGDIARKVCFMAYDDSDANRVTPKTSLAGTAVYYSLDGGTATVMTEPTITELDAINAEGLYALAIDEAGMVTLPDDTNEAQLQLYISGTNMIPVVLSLDVYGTDTEPLSTYGVATTAKVDDVNTALMTELADVNTAIVASVNDTNNVLYVKISDVNTAVLAKVSDVNTAILANVGDVNNVLYAHTSEVNDVLLAKISDSNDNLLAAIAGANDVIVATVNDVNDILLAAVSDANSKALTKADVNDCTPYISWAKITDTNEIVDFNGTTFRRVFDSYYENPEGRALDSIRDSATPVQ